MGDQSAEVDEQLAPLFRLLWSAGIRTLYSCQCHRPTGKVWIAFESAQDAELFLAAVIGEGPDDRWALAERWFFSAYGSEAKALTPPFAPALHPAGWEFFASVHPVKTVGRTGVGIGIDVLFPTHDLQRVIARVARSLGRT